MIHLDYRDARPIYTQIADGFRRQIATGVLQDGDRLPSVRELAAQLTINPNTIQRAYRELEAEGVIASVPGKGSFVCPGADSNDIRRLQRQLEETAAALEDLGISREALAQMILKGGNEHA